MKKNRTFEELDLDVNFDFNMDSGDITANLPGTDPRENVDYKGEPEHDFNAEMDEFQKQQREQTRKYEQRLADIYDTGFYFCVSFKNEQAKKMFFKEFGLENLGPKFVDGDKLSKALRNMKIKKQAAR